MTTPQGMLAPCPFCGSPATLTRFVAGDAPVAITHIECGNDEGCKMCVDIKNVNEAVAIEAWNTRQAAANGAGQTLQGMIAAIYGSLDTEDCAMVDREWARMRGYILPNDGTSTLSLAALAQAQEPGEDADKIALDAAHQIEALPSDLHEAQKTARIQLIILAAIRVETIKAKPNRPTLAALSHNGTRKET